MRKYTLILAAIALFAAGAATAAVTVNLNGYRGITVGLEPIGNCGPTGDCTFMVTVQGTATSDSDLTKSATLQFRSDDAAYGLNPTTTTAFYRKSRRAWKKTVLNEDAD